MVSLFHPCCCAHLIASFTPLGPRLLPTPSLLYVSQQGPGGGLSRGCHVTPAEGVCSSTWLSWELLRTILKRRLPKLTCVSAFNTLILWVEMKRSTSVSV